MVCVKCSPLGRNQLSFLASSHLCLHNPQSQLYAQTHSPKDPLKRLCQCACSGSHSGQDNDRSWPSLGDLWIIHRFFSMSAGMQRCHCGLSASCLWHSSLFRSPLKKQDSFLSPLVRQRRGVNGSLFLISPADQRNSYPQRETWVANSSFPSRNRVFCDFFKPQATDRSQH